MIPASSRGGAARRRMLRLPRPTIRLRLTLLYSALFLLTGAAVLGITEITSAATGLVVQVGSGGQVAITFENPLSGGGSSTSVAPFGGSPANLPGVIQAVVASQRAAEEHLHLVLSAVALATLSIASVAIGWFVAGRVLRPLRSMTGAARAISSTNLELRLAPNGPDDELKDLGETFDDLLGRLERSFDAQRQFVANASHELRTPLTRQRALVQYALADPAPTLDGWRATFERVLVAEQQQEALLEALFVLARSERGLERRVPVDLAEIAGAALRARVHDIEGRGLHVSVSLAPAVVAGDARLLERLAVNLIDNAARYNVPDGDITITTEVHEGDVTLRIGNSGAVLAPDGVDRLFEPFRRLEPDRTAREDGLGLGLSIVRAVAIAHDGAALARASEAGGLVVEVRLPALSGPPVRSAVEP